MRKLLLLLGLCLPLMATAQDRAIKFEENVSFAEAVAKAKADNKLLFVDCYTSWCGPCKMLARDVFTNNEVADYFNVNFINFKVDCEKGEGPELASKYKINSYPTLLFIDGDGNLNTRLTGTSAPPVFLNKVKKSLDPKNSLALKEKKFEEGCRDREFILDLINTYKRMGNRQKAAEVSRDYVDNLHKTVYFDKELWEVISDYYVSGYGSKWWNFLMENSDRYISMVGQEAFANKVEEKMHPYLFSYAIGRKKAATQTELDEMQSIINKYPAKYNKTLGQFITLAQSSSFGTHSDYIKTLSDIVPQMESSEHYRLFYNAMPYIKQGMTKQEKKQITRLLDESKLRQNEHMAANYQKLFDMLNAE